MRAPQGYSIVVDPDLPVPTERDNISCGHCQRIVFVKANSACTVYLIWDPPAQQWREEPGAFCRVCMRPICLRCHELGRCTPWERMLERMEARRGWWRQFLRLGG